jgi:hypothetical protein
MVQTLEEVVNLAHYNSVAFGTHDVVPVNGVRFIEELLRAGFVIIPIEPNNADLLNMAKILADFGAGRFAVAADTYAALVKRRKEVR